MTAPKPAHQDDAAVDALAATMKAKMAKQRAKGYSGWDTPEFTQQRLSDMLRAHVDKGDPVDVANFCAFLAARGEGIAHAAQGDALSWLQANDMAALERFAETTDDDESYDIGKDAVQRLAGFGCLRSHGFGKYSITDFGHYVLNDWSLARELPFKSQSEHAHGIGIKKGDSHD